MVRARDLVGRKIVAVRFNRYRCRTGNKFDWATQPEITLDNGRILRFVTQETDYGDYGTKLVLTATRPEQKPC